MTKSHTTQPQSLRLTLEVQLGGRLSAFILRALPSRMLIGPKTYFSTNTGRSIVAATVVTLGRRFTAAYLPMESSAACMTLRSLSPDGHAPQ